MNILIPYSWLKEYLQTKATAQQMADCLSLCSQSVEKINRVGKDYVFDVEVTTNRPDCLSIYGLARELAAILPQFGIKAQLKKIPELSFKIPAVKKSLPLKVKIQKPSLCPRFTALVFDQVVVKSSPKIIQERLQKSGIRSLNNVVDISNYLMLELGQPMHTFDYDKIAQATMIMGEAKQGEKIITLDGQARSLPTGTIIIKDGEGRIIDLCGIMGGQNSAVDQKTQRVLLFVQTYDPHQIRRSCQQMAFRTDAAQRFEKGLEPEGVIPAMKKATIMLQKLCQAKVASQLFDLYPQPSKTKTVSVSLTKINQLMGITIKPRQAQKILTNLGFAVQIKNQQIIATVPYWRQGDVTLPEDLIEEIARIYGYHNLPSVLPTGRLPQAPANPSFGWEHQIKQALKYWGWTEVVNYSLVSRRLVEKAGFEPNQCLQIANPLSEELVLMRPSLLPSLKEASSNKIFEMANIYLPAGKTKLPEENLRLAGVTNQPAFYQLKGIVEAILLEMGVKAKFRTAPDHPKIAQILQKDKILGTIGETFFDLDFDLLVELAKKEKKYQPVSQTPPVIEDLTFVLPPQTPVGELIETIKATDCLIKQVQLISTFNNNVSFRLFYQHPQKTLTHRQVEKIRNKIIQRVEKNFQAKLKS